GERSKCNRRPHWGGSFLRQLTPDPLREHPFFTRGRRQTSVERLRVGLAVAGDIGEKQGVALVGAEVQIDLGKACFAAGIASVEIDQESRNALTEMCELIAIGRHGGIEKVVVRLELLPDGIMQKLRRFE